MTYRKYIYKYVYFPHYLFTMLFPDIYIYIYINIPIYHTKCIITSSIPFIFVYIDNGRRRNQS